MRFGFHAFGNHAEIEAVRHVDNRPHHHLILFRTADVAGQTAVDLQIVDRQFLQIGQAAVAGSEVVDRYAYPRFPQAAQLVGGLREIADQFGFGDFEGQAIRVETRNINLPQHILVKSSCREIPRGNIDRQAQETETVRPTCSKRQRLLVNLGR